MAGKTVTLRGTAVDRKGGAALKDKESFVWIDGLDRWPDELREREVEVSGLLERETDPAVFVPTAGEPIAQGIPASAAGSSTQGRQRYVLREATWKPLH